MKPRDRVMLALNHKEPDRVPIDLGSTIVTSITKSAYIDVMSHVGLPVGELRMLDYVQQLPHVDEALMERFRVDFRPVLLPPIMASQPAISEDGEYLAFHNKWGARLRMPREGGLYFDYAEFPILEPTLDALDRYSWPAVVDPSGNAQLRKRAEHLYENTDYALIGGVVIGGGIFEQPARMMGTDTFLSALVLEPSFAERILERITGLYIEACESYLRELGPYLQVFTLWDDVCGQQGWLISPELYCRMVKPRQRRLIEAIKHRTDAKVFYHGCGAVFDLIPHLIEIGVDIINPVQVSARGMDTKRLKEAYGRDIVFWGGGVDTQRILPFGRPEEVADEVRRRIDDLAPGGGFVFATVHNIQAFVPAANVVAAFDTALEHGWY